MLLTRKIKVLTTLTRLQITLLQKAPKAPGAFLFASIGELCFENDKTRLFLYLTPKTNSFIIS